MATQETVYLQDADVQVTNARAVLGSKTYAMSNITSVSMGVIPANRALGFVVAAAGVLLAACGGASGSNGSAILIVGILIAAGGLALAFMVKEKYAVRVGSASGESDGLVDSDRERIQRVVNAVNEAIIKRG